MEYLGYPSDSIDADDLGAEHSSGAGPQNYFQNTSDCIISQPTGPSSLAERMLGALSLFKDSSLWVIYVQVWVPIRSGDQYVLSTSEQPFLVSPNASMFYH